MYYIRFNIFHELGRHPILVAGNEKSKAFFWDLQKLEQTPRLEDGDGESRDIGDPFRSIKAHKVIAVPKYKLFTFRQFAWSNDGQWCVGVGDHGCVGLDIGF